MVPLNKLKELLSIRGGALFFPVQIGLLALISHCSGYQLRVPGYVVNFEIATMFTPVGIAANLLGNSYLRPFYFRAPHRESLLQSPALFLAVWAAAGAGLFALFLLKRAGTGK